MMSKAIILLIILFILFDNTIVTAQIKTVSPLTRIKGTQPRNIIFILTDDHRFDFMGFTGKLPWLKTPNMDLLFKQGAWFRNAYVTTALCSPSRASILTGAYSHVHTIVDNVAPEPANNIYFPSYLQ